MNLISGIYALKCPSTGEVRYVGKSKNIKKRFSAHCMAGTKSGYPVSFWIDKLRKLGLRPVLEVLLETENVDEEEIKFIAHYRAIGCNLLNLHSGGAMPASMGNGKTKDVFSVSGLLSPWMILCRSMMGLRQRSDVIDSAMRLLKSQYDECKTEKDRLEFQLKCFGIVQDVCKVEAQDKVEQWIIKAAPQINKVYKGRITLAFNGEVYTP